MRRFVVSLVAALLIAVAAAPAGATLGAYNCNNAGTGEGTQCMGLLYMGASNIRGFATTPEMTEQYLGNTAPTGSYSQVVMGIHSLTANREIGAGIRHSLDGVGGADDYETFWYVLTPTSYTYHLVNFYGTFDNQAKSLSVVRGSSTNHFNLSIDGVTINNVDGGFWSGYLLGGHEIYRSRPTATTVGASGTTVVDQGGSLVLFNPDSEHDDTPYTPGTWTLYSYSDGSWQWALNPD